VAAVYWYRSSAVDFKQYSSRFPDENKLASVRTNAIMSAMWDAAELNKKAALWTAASVMLSALSSVAASAG
jgi:hypothetical protein